jgi:hypothetical protein
MSSAMKKNSTMNKKPFCKVCFDAGKDSAHPLRNTAGQTVCPYLLSLQCNNCHKSGHTVKYCTSPKKMNTATRTPQQNQATQKQATPVQATPNQAQPNKKAEKQKPKSHFDVFQQLIAEEEEQELERESEELARRLQELAHKTNFPAISEKKIVSKTSDRILTGWSKAVGKTVKVYETLSEEEEDSPAEKKVPQKKEQQQKEQQQVKEQQQKEHVKQHMEARHMEEEHIQEQQEQEDLEQQLKEDHMEEDLEEQAQTVPEQNPYRPTYSSWADCE